MSRRGHRNSLSLLTKVGSIPRIAPGTNRRQHTDRDVTVAKQSQPADDTPYSSFVSSFVETVENLCDEGIRTF
jgi:hypothetical protein